MSLASESLEDLDSFLLEQGSDAVLRRMPLSTTSDVTVRAWVPGGLPDPLINQITQNWIDVVISSTQIIEAGWTSVSGATSRDARVPVKGNKVIFKGVTYNVEDANPIYVNDELVRVNMRALGG